MVESARSPLPTGPQARAANTRIIDIHGHTFAPEVEKLIADRPERAAEMAAMAVASGPDSHQHNLTDMLPKAAERMASLEKRLRDMDWMGIDLQLVSPSPTQYGYWADAVLADEIVAATNAAVAALVARSPDRLAGLGTVSLQHPERAAAQLSVLGDRHGLKGIQISASVGERELSDPSFEPFWQAANARKLLVFIHPMGSSLGARLDRHYLSNTVGQPIETTIALSHLIFSGVLDRYPDIRFLGAHGGGYLPAYIGRSDHVWKVRPEARRCRERPSAYLRRIWVDTVVFDGDELTRLIDVMGADRVLFGTDYPYDMGSYTPGALLKQAGLDDTARRAVLADNAMALLG
ncbi:MULTISPECIES: amidohydrolase family protein [unclassified Beijerinckia]|uniref:amidohydrolase family protein n=1 Tax=unclassified Beijerinckia TaxID=2638183 RepID=UPI00089C47B3|nr:MULTISPECIES: amidohydrolase family protein [unclassified Beijerinckia]MDH7794263.1 aminocarboxymuconate-semialdehyde decarboxylase [Beijerinckia sp. GAS462]SEB57164.1 aminocarboxymuconate-semialdehyde decarboxylase [Beijerinckia sp. 28-YEA-48]